MPRLTPIIPKAKTDPVVTVLHGETRVDAYSWMREKDDPEVIAYLEAENAYAEAVLAPTAELQERLYQETLGRIQETDRSVPYLQGDAYYYTRTERGLQYPIYCRRRGNLEAPEEVLLDLNEMARGEKFLALGALEVSDDGNLLAYSTDVTGFRDYTLRVKDLTGKTQYREAIPHVAGVAWAADNRTLLYVTEDDAKRSYRLYRHPLGSRLADQLLYEEADGMFYLDVERSSSGAFVFAISASKTASEVRFLSASNPAGSLRLLAARQKDHEYEADHRGNLFYIRSNASGPNFAVMTAPVSDPVQGNWTEFVAHRNEVLIEGLQVFAGHLALSIWKDAVPGLEIFVFASGIWRTLEFSESAYAIFPEENRDFDAPAFRFEYQSLTTPATVFDYEVESGRHIMLKRTEVLGGYDPSRYRTDLVFATGADGARIPISLVAAKSTPRDGTSALHLLGYGSYGLPYHVSFSAARISLLDRGVTCAIAHVRGGGELGKAWHEQGRMRNKCNTFTDFIAAAEFLVAEKYTAPERLVIDGRSAGGLLVGAVVNMRPDLFKAAILSVPFLDVINTMLDTALPLTVTEFEEWGNPALHEDYESIRAYCPYTNIAPHDYPALLVKTSFNDSQVMYWEPAKFVAKLRATNTGDRPVIFKIDMDCGHGGASGRYDKLREVALEQAFILWQVTSD